MRWGGRHLGRGVLAWLLLVLGACATVQKIQPQAGAGLDVFSRTGRFSLIVQAPDVPTRAIQGGFAWSDDGHTLRVNLSNPLGTILAQLRVEPGRAVLVRSDGVEEIADQPDVLLARALGRTVPVAGLRAWLRGSVAQHARVVQSDAAGHIVAFTQDGWQGQFARFDTHGPRLLRLARSDTGIDEHVQLRLVLDGE